jgi:hypothetical protein
MTLTQPAIHFSKKTRPWNESRILRDEYGLTFDDSGKSGNGCGKPHDENPKPDPNPGPRLLLLTALLAVMGLMGLNKPCFPQNSGPGIAHDHAELVQHFSQSLDPDDFESPEDWEAYIQELLDLFPVDLNIASRNDLLLIPGMTYRLADAIISFRSGQRFRYIEDLAGVPGIGPATVEMLRPWVTVRGRRGKGGWTRDIGVQQYFRYQQTFPMAAGYASSEDQPPHYIGTPARLYHRQTITSAALSANLTQVKLPGEPYTIPYGFDFTSAHLAYQGSGYVRRVVFGDYSARFGQGLVLWSSASFGKGGTAHTAPYRRSQGIRPYSSSGQIRFFRGAAMEAAMPVPRRLTGNGHELTVSIMHSSRRRSAAVVNGDSIRPPSSSPFHRTIAERDRRNNVRETVSGGNISWKHPHFSFGMTWVTYGLDRPVLPHPVSSPLAGKNHRAWGVDAAFLYGNTRIFGEHAWRRESNPATNLSGSTAWVAGFMSTYPDKSDWVFAMRRYQSGYRTEFASGFGEGSGTPTNQYGWYAGVRLRPSARLQVSGFLDRFRFPAPARNHIRPGGGWEAMLLAHHRQRSGLELQGAVRYKLRTTERDVLDDFHRRQRVSGTIERLHARLQTNWHAHRRLYLRYRFDSSVTSSTASGNYRGIAVSKTIRWQVTTSLRTDIGWSFFDTDDFSTRLYQYEYDLTRMMTSRMLYGLGRITYVVIRWQPVSWALAELKYARVRYFDRPAAGSGHDQTPGSIRSELGMQLRLSY